MTDPLLHGRYELRAPVAEGGSGTVFLAVDTRLPGRECAVKRISLGDDPGPAEKALRAEAEALSHLDHPALPGVSDFFVEEDRAYLVMDFVPGRDLNAVVVDAWRHGRSLPEAQVLDWADELCAALTYLHRQVPPVIHRDVKPANIKLTPDGQIRLVDFGLARPVPDAHGRTVTVLGDAGSRPYQPLEQYGEGRAVDARSDLYALSASLFHLLAGRAPPSAQDRFLAPETDEALGALRSDLSPATVRAVEAGMQLHPGDRPDTVDDWHRILRMGTAPAGGEWAAALRSNLWLIAGVLIMLLAALAMSVAP